MKKIRLFLIILATFFGADCFAQYTIDYCQTKAKDNYPMIVQYGMIESSREFRLDNANKNFLPQISLSAKASYQSEVTEIPFTLPGATIKSMSKDQYSAVVQLDQTIWDGGTTMSQKEGIKAQSGLEKSKLDVDIYALKERVNQLFFGIVLLNEQLLQTEILKRELERSYNQVSSYMHNGMANQSDIDAVKVEQLNTLQRETEILANKEAFISMLSAMLGEKINSDATFEKPATPGYSKENKRPELDFFQAQGLFYDSQASLIAAKNRIKAGAYIQVGYGRPGLNMLKAEFSPFYIAGVKVAWNLGGVYTKKNELKLIDISRRTADNQKEIFLYNSNLKSTQQSVAINKIKMLMERDDELITLRENIKKAAEVKLQNGTISVSELLREINLLDIARTNRARHDIELIMAIYDLKNTTNN
ncbi:MAG: transporter [Bacteroidetes bacterium GWF2_40_14]|nr:MAG: transporter [Bacteroidetes bacterium GWF2_40_14]